MENLPIYLAFFAILIVSLSIHEAAHAWTANLLGDPTARLLGRMTINPIPHIDPIGTLLLPGIAIFTGLPLIGWAKPVPVSFQNLRHPRRDFMYIAAAGPASNLLQALVIAIVARVMYPDGILYVEGMTRALLIVGVQMNVTLAVFNMIPVPPLDGGNVLGGLLPERLALSYDRVIRPFGFLILYGLLLTGVFSAVIMPPANFLTRLLLP